MTVSKLMAGASKEQRKRPDHEAADEDDSEKVTTCFIDAILECPSTMTTPLRPGVRVVRGPDWRWANQDGGEGCAGTVVEVASRTAKDDIVTVRWDLGTIGSYRTGHQNAYDLRVIDNAPSGVRHFVPCVSCKKSMPSVASEDSGGGNGDNQIGIFGIRWHCTECHKGYDLCTICYMDDRHDLSHKFLRIDQVSERTHQPGIPMPPRKGCKKVTLRGLYHGAKVKRSTDWSWDDQDGGPGKVGKLNRIQNWDQTSGRSVASVTWSSTGLSNVYRAGHKGKVDIECVQAATHGPYYPDHLPVLGKAASLFVDMDSLPALPSIPAATAAAPGAAPSLYPMVGQSPPLLARAPPHPAQGGGGGGLHDVKFEVGDSVKIDVSMDDLRLLQEHHGGFNPKMASVLGLTGKVHRLTTGGDVRVQYPGQPEASFRWTINPRALKTVNSFKVGDLVMPSAADPATFQQLQKDHGGWIPLMKDAIGRVGKVVKVYGDGDVRVNIIGNTWTFNPACLSHASSATTDNNDSPVHQLHQAGRGSTNRKQNGYGNGGEEANDRRFLSAASKGDLNFVQKMLDEEEGQQQKAPATKTVRSAIQATSQNGHLTVLQLLARKFPEEINSTCQGKTALHVAAHAGHLEVIEFLLNESLGLLEARDDEGDSALHYAAYGKRIEVIKKLLSVGADPNAFNEKKCSVLHIAVVMEDPAIVEILLRQPGIDCNVCDAYDDSPLHEAIVKASPDVVDLLCAIPDISLTSVNERGFNCLQWACLKGNAHAVKRIIQRSRELIDVTKDDGFSPIQIAALNGHYEVVRLLAEEGQAQVEARDERGQNALHHAVIQGHAPVIEYLVSANYGPMMLDVQDIAGDTPLHISVRKEGEPSQLKEEAMERHAPQILATITKAKAIGLSAKLTHSMGIAGYLVSKGASTSIKNVDGFSPMDLMLDPVAKLFIVEFITTSTAAATAEGGAARGATASTPSSSRASLRSEATTVSSASIECQICCEPMPNQNSKPVRFEPCGHVVVCTECCPRMKKCIECKEKIERKVVINKDPAAAAADGEDDEIKSLKTLKLHVLEAKVNDWEEHYTCSICMERKKNVAFMCGHGACSVCVQTLKVCHMCRGPISQKINLY